MEYADSKIEVLCLYFSDSTRILFATWWIFITILTSFYTANLTAFLTLSKFTLPIEGPKDLAKTRAGWIAHKGSPLEYQVEVSEMLMIC